MRAMNAAKSLFFSWDWLAAFVATLVISFLVPGGVSCLMAKELFSVSTSVLSIIFSVFFAALAVLITAGDNEFIRFLVEDGSYRQIVWTFKVTLLLLFVSLLASIVLFVIVLPYSEQELGNLYYPEWLMLLFSFLALYALFAAINSSLDAIKYAEYRARFLEVVEDKLWKDS